LWIKFFLALFRWFSRSFTPQFKMQKPRLSRPFSLCSRHTCKRGGLRGCALEGWMCSGCALLLPLYPCAPRMCVYLDGLFIERPGRCMFSLSLIVAQNNGPFSAYTSRARPAAAGGAGMSLVAGARPRVNICTPSALVSSAALNRFWPSLKRRYRSRRGNSALQCEKRRKEIWNWDPVWRMRQEIMQHAAQKW